MSHQNEWRSRVLREAVRDGVIDSPFKRYWSPAVVRAMQLARQVQPEHYDPNFNNLLQHPKSLRWREHTYPALAHDNQTYWCTELARIAVPEGMVGYLENIDQVLNDAAGSYFPSNLQYWGSPRFEVQEVDDCKWWLTIEPYYQTQPGRFDLTSALPFDISRLPGRPFEELYEILGMWYPAGQFKPIRSIIPTGSILRFYFYTPPQSIYQWRPSGRLSARIQSTFSDEAMENARRLC